tara:strand:- start:1113 stop:1511 length:399 start_codon:yes stop_codon:yes gene_type:complete
MIKTLTYLSVAVALSACLTLPQDPQVTTLANDSQVAIQNTSELPNCEGNNASTWTNCFGTFTLPNGSKYVGDWKDGIFNGQGTATVADGAKYVGEWKDGKRSGQGTLTHADGKIEEGIWKWNNTKRHLERPE